MFAAVSRAFSKTPGNRNTMHVMRRFLELVPDSPDIAMYLRQFAAVDKQQFAIIKVGGAVLSEDLEKLGDSLSFLQQVGLFPVVVHGGGPQLNKRLEALGEEAKYVNGLRVTSPEVLAIALEVFYEENAKLVDHLESIGTRARPILSGVFEAKPLDPKIYGLVGDVTRIHTEAINRAIKVQQMPILASIGHTITGQALNINADVAASSLAQSLQPLKTVYLNTTGGLFDGEGRVLDSISLNDYPTLMAEPWMKHGTRLKLVEIKELLDKLPPNSSVSITRAQDLPKELFTHTGAGTIIRKGVQFHRITSYQELTQKIDLKTLRDILESSFKQRLEANYFETMVKNNLHTCYISEDSLAAAILLKPDGLKVPYLCKFAVSPNAQGLGIGELMWSEIRRDNPALFWRSRNSNPINRWYFKQSSASFTDDRWTVFVYGVKEFDETQKLINYARSVKYTMLGPLDIESN